MTTATTLANPLQRYLAAMERAGVCRNRGDLLFALTTLFAGVDFAGKRLLDIGGGTGKFSAYAATMGAARALCLEPEAHGSHGGMQDRFAQLRNELGFPNLELMPTTLQEFDPTGEQFDIVLLHNSVNHLDEAACITLHERDVSRHTYRSLLAKVFSLCAPGALLMVCDCSRHNFFARLGVRNPVNPTIEWHKHQPPELWIELLSAVGFVQPRVRWTPISQLRTAGRVLLANRAASYFLRSHFCLTMVRPLSQRTA